jgi:hypothetical protein
MTTPGIHIEHVSVQYGVPQFMTVMTDLRRRSVRECVPGKSKGLAPGWFSRNDRVP